MLKLTRHTALALAATLSLSVFAAPKEKKAKAPAAGTPVVYVVDAAASQVNWLGKKVTGQHNGKIKIKSGKLDVAGDSIKGGSFELDMTSITVEDLKDPETAGKLIGHLKSDDFFGVEKFPVSTFKITSVKGKEITGDLTIKGVTKPISFASDVTIKDGVLTAKASIPVDRTVWDLRYGSGKFFKGLGDKVIADVFNIDLSLVAHTSK